MADESVTEFLKRTTGPGSTAASATTGGETPAQFLARTGGATKSTDTSLPGPVVPSADEQSADTGLPLPRSPPPQPAPPPYSVLPAFPGGATGGGLGDPGTLTGAFLEGARGAPDASGWAPGGVQLGRYIVNPLLELGGGLVRGGQQVLENTAEPFGAAVPQIRIPTTTIPGFGTFSGTIAGGPGLGRDVAAFPEAFPTGDYGAPEAPPTAQAARNALKQPVTVEDLIGAIRRAPDEPPGGGGAPNALQPDRAPQAPATGLADLGGAAQAMGANLRDMLWDKLQKGDTTELGQPSRILMDAKTAMDQGVIKSRADFDAWTQQWGAQQQAARNATTPQQGTPQPTGAQVTPTSAAQMTPEQIATQRTVADKQWLNQTQQPGVQDTTVHIPGITPNLVEQEQTVTAARELKALKNLNPELSQAERELLDHNTDLRKGFYADTVGSEVTRAADLKAANDKINTDLAQVWQGKGEADPTNVRAQINTELAGSAGDLPPLKSAMKQVGDSLENAGTDPQAMYRTHRLINYLQSKQGQLENPGYGAADVQAALTRTKGVLAQTIDDAAPGFGKAMSDYAGARGPIDAAKALQDRENGLYDSRGHMSFLKVHGLMRDIVDAQKWDAPNNPLAGVSDAQMTRLKALHDDLKRVASAKDLATAQGSDTAMNAVDIAKAYGKLATRAGVEGGASWLFGPGTGSLVVRGAENLLRPFTSGIAGRKQMRRGMEILQPPPSNPLQPP